MKEITLEELKSIELNVLAEIHKICMEQGLRYSLSGGTLLGAIRHGGFIPWDDDIDILMPRPDYDKLVEYCKENDTPFNLLCHETDSRYGYLFAKATAKNTVIEEDVGDLNGIKMGVYVDIFPIDGLANTYEEALKEFKATKLNREMLVARNWKKFVRSKTRSWKYEPIRFAFFLASRFTTRQRLINKLQSKFRKNNFDKCDYVAAIFGLYREKEIIKKEVLDEFIDITFEGMTFRAIKRYDDYLSSVYGDYMQLPPEEKRVSHHSFKAYYLD